MSEAKVLALPSLARRWVEGAQESTEAAREQLADVVDTLALVTEAAPAQAALARAHDAVRAAEAEVAKLLKRPRLTLSEDATRYLNPEAAEVRQ